MWIGKFESAEQTAVLLSFVQNYSRGAHFRHLLRPALPDCGEKSALNPYARFHDLVKVMMVPPAQAEPGLIAQDHHIISIKGGE